MLVDSWSNLCAHEHESNSSCRKIVKSRLCGHEIILEAKRTGWNSMKNVKYNTNRKTISSPKGGSLVSSLHRWWSCVEVGVGWSWGALMFGLEMGWGWSRVRWRSQWCLRNGRLRVVDMGWGWAAVHWRARWFLRCVVSRWKPTFWWCQVKPLSRRCGSWQNVVTDGENWASRLVYQVMHDDLNAGVSVCLCMYEHLRTCIYMEPKSHQSQNTWLRNINEQTTESIGKRSETCTGRICTCFLSWFFPGNLRSWPYIHTHTDIYICT